MTNDKKNTTSKIHFPLPDIMALSKLTIELRKENRYFLSEISEKFVNNLILYAKRFKIHRVARGIELYRSRIDKFDNKEHHYSLDDMGAPPPSNAREGRVNPVGIPYLYLSSNIDTAVAEVRPWIKCNITVAKFSLKRDVELINVSNKVFLNIPSDEEMKGAEFTWREFITYLFSMPFDPRDDTRYIPIQYLSERIKKEGFDGILYDSSLNESGYNICLFDVNLAYAVELFQVEVKSMNYQLKINELKND